MLAIASVALTCALEASALDAAAGALVSVESAGFFLAHAGETQKIPAKSPVASNGKMDVRDNFIMD